MSVHKLAECFNTSCHYYQEQTTQHGGYYSMHLIPHEELKVLIATVPSRLMQLF